MNINEFSKLSREDLYEKVWSAPGTKLSEELGISDVAIAKRCKKLNVPRPPRGYWAKLEAGHRQSGLLCQLRLKRYLSKKPESL